jgi:hypothetical protein
MSSAIDITKFPVIFRERLAKYLGQGTPATREEQGQT